MNPSRTNAPLTQLRPPQRPTARPRPADREPGTRVIDYHDIVARYLTGAGFTSHRVPPRKFHSDNPATGVLATYGPP